MTAKYKCIVEIECSPKFPKGSSEPLAQMIHEYKKRLNESIENKIGDSITDSVVSEHDYAYVHLERVYLTFE